MIMSALSLCQFDAPCKLTSMMRCFGCADACAGPHLKDEQLRQVWNVLPDAAAGIFDGFTEAFRLAHQATIWGIPSVQVHAHHFFSTLFHSQQVPEWLRDARHIPSALHFLAYIKQAGACL